MKTTVRTFWIAMLLMLTCCISGKAIDLAKTTDRLINAGEVSASLSSCSSVTDDIQKNSSLFPKTKFMWATDVELGNKPLVETYSFNQQRLRRALETNIFFKNIFSILSSHEDILVQGQAQLLYSGKPLFSVLTGRDYYIYALRRILI